MTVNMRQYDSETIKRINMVTLICIVTAAFFVVLDYVTDGQFTEFSLGSVTLTFYHLFPFLLGALCGYIPATFSFLIIFIHCYTTYGIEAYTAIGYLIIAIIGDLMSRCKCFSNIRRILLSAVFLSFLSTNLWQLNLRALAGDVWDTTLMQELIYLLREFPQYVLCGFILYFVFVILDDKYKIYFLNANIYTNRYQKIYAGKGINTNYHTFSRSVIIVLSVDLLVVITATVFFMIPGDYLREYLATGSTYGKSMMLLLSIVMPCFLIANFAVQRHVIDPIRNMAIYLERLSNANDDSRQELIDEIYTLEPYFDDEIGELYNTMKDMVIEEENAIDQLRADSNIKNDIKVTTAANEAKSNFLSNMTHEIRTPINAILGMDEMILREADEAKVIEYAENIQRAGNSLLNLVNNVLDYAKLESGKMEIVNSEYDINAVLSRILNKARVYASDKNIEFNVFIDSNIPSVLYGDSYKLSYVIRALLDNAIKYTDSGHVIFSLNYELKSNDEIVLSAKVADTGIGLRQEDIEKIYIPFERIEENRNRTIQGSGLGISLMSEFLGMMNSHLTVESQYGKGSVFGFEVLQWVVSYEPAGEFTFDEVSIDEPVSGITLPDNRVLVVDDTLVNLTVMNGLLKKYQMTVVTAGSGYEALEILQDNTFDIIFLDHKMPGMDGIETLDEIKRRYGTRGAKFIALTANDNPAIRDYYIYEGFDDFLAKPIDSEILDKMIIQYLSGENEKV